MNDQTVVAESSAAEVEDVFRGENPSFDEFNSYRQTGELPDRFKPADIADPAPADAPQQTAVTPEDDEEPSESDPDSEPEESQEQPPKGSGAEKRIKQLLAEKKELQRKLEAAAKPDVKSDPSPAQANQQPQPQTYKDWFKTFDPDKWVEDFAKANPLLSYERANAAMTDHLGDVRDHFRRIEDQRQSQQQEITSKVTDARARYGEKFDEVLGPTLNTIVSDAQINPTVKAMLNDSDVVADLLYTIGSDPKTLSDFVAMAKNNPGKALRYIAVVENGIIEELSNGKEEPASEKAPEVKKTSAPKPPAPVSGASSRAFDVSDESLSADEWARKRTADIERRKKG